jgi:hypothetical protein
MGKMLFLALFVLLATPLFCEVTNIEVLQAVNTMQFGVLSRLDNIETRLGAVQRDVFNVQNDTLKSVNIALEAQSVKLTERIDAMDAKYEQQVDDLNRSLYAVTGLFVGITALFLAFVILPYYTSLTRYIAKVTELERERRAVPNETPGLPVKEDKANRVAKIVFESRRKVKKRV